jgi:double-stranded uracil-DNA glycosylase
MKRRPNKADLLASRGKTVPDVISPELRVLFCGINPGLYSGAVGHHFARPGNRFWPALHLSGFTPCQFTPDQEGKLPDYGLGITNLVERATASAAELNPQELVKGGRQISEKVRRYRPYILAILGIGAYRGAFGQPKAVIGPQAAEIGMCRLWVLPNPSGLNAHYTLEDLAKLFRQLKEAAFDTP